MECNEEKNQIYARDWHSIWFENDDDDDDNIHFSFD